MAKPWTTKEVKVLKELYPDHGSLGVSKALPNRTREAICGMARVLRIRANGKVGSGNKLGYFNIRRIQNAIQQKKA